MAGTAWQLDKIRLEAFGHVGADGLSWLRPSSAPTWTELVVVGVGVMVFADPILATESDVARLLVGVDPETLDDAGSVVTDGALSHGLAVSSEIVGDVMGLRVFGHAVIVPLASTNLSPLLTRVKWLLAFMMSLVIGCSTVTAPDGFPVVQAPIAGHTLSCKGTRCCWPWGDKDNLVVCVEPVPGNYLGAGGVMITVRGKMP